MPMPSSHLFFENMSNGQLRPNAIEDNRVLSAIGAVSREDFVPDALKDSAYVDRDLPLGEGRYLLEPLVFATLLEKAAIGPGDNVLIVGGGFGYSAAVISRLAGKVTLVEEDATMAGEAVKRLAAQGIPAQVIEGPLTEGALVNGPYDVILIEGATQHIPAGLASQLREGGRLVAVHCERLRAGSTSGLGQYLSIRREGQQFPLRLEGNAFVHLLPPFANPLSFTL